MSSDPNEYWLSVLEGRIPDLALPTDRGQIETIRAAVQRELDAVLCATSIVARRSNALLPSIRLPPEVISHIFTFCAIVEPPNRPEYQRGQGPNRMSSLDFKLGWIKVTHVCHHWREIALEDATLWANVECGFGVPWAKEMLSRAREAPLSFRVLMDFASRYPAYGVESPQQPVFLSDELSLSTRISRIRRLVLRGREATVMRVVPWLCAPAPALRTVALDMPLTTAWSPGKPLPDDAFSGAPSLRHLFLSGFTVSWKSTMFSSLTHLRISPPLPQPIPAPGSWVSQVPAAEFYACLDGMKALQHLLLGICLPNHLQGSSANDRVIELPSLRSLSITGPTFDCTGFMARITFPPDVAFDVTCYTLQSSADEFAAALGWLAKASAAMDRHSGAPQAWCRVDFSSSHGVFQHDRQVAFRAYNKAQTLRDPFGWPKGFLRPFPEPFRDVYDPSDMEKAKQLSLRWYDWFPGVDVPETDAEPSSFAKRLVDILPADAGVLELVVNVDNASAWTPQTWSDLSARFPNVEHLYVLQVELLVSLCLASGFDDNATASQSWDASASHAKDPLFPKLAHVITWALVLEIDSTFHPFLAYLGARKSAGCPLAKLTLEGSPPGEMERVEQLRELVTTLNTHFDDPFGHPTASMDLMQTFSAFSPALMEGL